jgi:hypothetical protein
MSLVSASLTLAISLICCFLILAFTKLIKEEGGLLLFTKFAIITAISSAIIAYLIMLPVKDCQGILCGLENFLSAVAIDGIIVFFTGGFYFEKLSIKKKNFT